MNQTAPYPFFQDEAAVRTVSPSGEQLLSHLNTRAHMAETQF